MAEAKNQEILKRLTAGVGNLSRLAPAATKTFLEFDKTAGQPGVLDKKTKELMAVALAVAARCDGCIAVHVSAALKAGASPEEIGETLGVAVSMGGGPSLVYATRALEAMEEFSASH